MRSLLEISRGYDTDKRAHRYIQYYEKHFADIRMSATDVCEVGVFGGESLRMWAEYFPNATVHGIDINAECRRYASDRVRILIADQKDARVRDYLRGGVDVLIDDGSHVPMDVVTTFDGVFPLVRPGGFYVVEDLHTSSSGVSPFQYSFMKVQSDAMDSLNYMRPGEGPNWPTYDQVSDETAGYLAKTVGEMHCYRFITFIKKHRNENDFSV